MATLDEIRAVIDDYAPVLTSGELMRIAEKEGWVEARSEGGHRVFVYPADPSYGHITFKCHQEGADCNRIVTRRRLTEIYQPALDHASEDAEHQERLKQQINQLADILERCEADFVYRAERKLQELQKRVDRYEIDCLEECEQTMQRFLDDCKEGSIAQKDQEIQAAKEALERVQQEIRILEAKERSLNESLTLQVQGKEQELSIAQEQITTLQQALQQKNTALEELTHDRNQIHSRFKRFRRRIMIFALILLGLISALTLKECYSAPAPSQSIPMQQ